MLTLLTCDEVRIEQALESVFARVLMRNCWRPSALGTDVLRFSLKNNGDREGELFPSCCPDLFDEHEKMAIVRRERDKPAMVIKRGCRGPFSMNGKGSTPTLSASCKVCGRSWHGMSFLKSMHSMSTCANICQASLSVASKVKKLKPRPPKGGCAKPPLIYSCTVTGAQRVKIPRRWLDVG